jgi:hypothetical protein
MCSELGHNPFGACIVAHLLSFSWGLLVRKTSRMRIASAGLRSSRPLRAPSSKSCSLICTGDACSVYAHAGGIGRHACAIDDVASSMRTARHLLEARFRSKAKCMHPLDHCTGERRYWCKLAALSWRGDACCWAVDQYTMHASSTACC